MLVLILIVVVLILLVCVVNLLATLAMGSAMHKVLAKKTAIEPQPEPPAKPVRPIPEKGLVDP